MDKRLLPEELQALIYEYDPTYRDRFKDVVTHLETFKVSSKNYVFPIFYSPVLFPGKTFSIVSSTGDFLRLQNSISGNPFIDMAIPYYTLILNFKIYDITNRYESLFTYY
jgi:hypothetical protein